MTQLCKYIMANVYIEDWIVLYIYLFICEVLYIKRDEDDEKWGRALASKEYFIIEDFE